jgi:hypothetical protein
MRRILVDAARKRGSAKRGGTIRVEHSSPIDFDRPPAVGSDRATKLCALHDALNSLSLPVLA